MKRIRLKNLLMTNSPGIIIFCSVIICVYICAAVFVSGDPDLFWHLKNGERLIRDGIFPVKDVFSFTGYGKFLVAYEWLAEGIFYIVHETAGYAGLLVVSCLLIYLTLHFFYRLIRSLGINNLLTMVLCIFLLSNFTRYLSIRTQLFSFMFFAIILFLVNTENYQKLRVKILVALIIMLWSQMHGGFILGIILVSTAAINECINKHTIRLSTFIFPACLVFLTGLHPSGYYSIVYPLWMFLKRPAVCKNVMEWSPVDFSLMVNAPNSIFLMVLLFLGIRNSQKFHAWMVLTLITVFFAMGNNKLIPYAAMLGIFLIAINLVSLNIVSIKKRFLILVLSLFLCLMLYILKDLFRSPELFDRPFIERKYPKEAANYIKQHLKGRFIFNPYHWGGYFLYKLYPHNLIFIDGRADLYWKIMANEYQKVLDIHPETLKILDEFNIDVVVIPKEFKLAMLLAFNDEWGMVIESDVAYLFVRKQIFNPA